ncbi:MAG TPA: EpsI family protein [Desulfobacterales bacterium]|nr:EpsI family protein [Desulfobacterales bacterium]
MGRKGCKRIIIVIICFAFASTLIYRQSASKTYRKSESLCQAFSGMQDWTGNGPISLDKKVMESLELDDYINQSYSNGTETVSLYVGYYLTAKKVGAAHSPLVCFPGQGWQVSDTGRESVTVGDHDIDASVMVVSRGDVKDLIIYWFQAFDKTSSGTFLQKIQTLWSKIIHSREDNAFVRISVSMNGRSKSDARTTGRKFINVFYPRFLEYVKDHA